MSRSFPTPVPAQRQQISHMDLDVHIGEVLFRLAGTYNTLEKTILEMIQNALDSSASRILVQIDLEKRTVVVADNGSGIDPDKFRGALRSVGRSVKPRQGTLGRFGIGLISPLDLVSTYLVTSRDTTTGRINQWAFVPSEIKKQASNLQIPMTELSKFKQPASPWQDNVTFNTVMRLTGIKSDRASTHVNLTELAENVMANFTVAMLRHDTVCHIALRDENGTFTSQDVYPRTFTGKPFDEFVYHDVDAGQVVFRMYRAPKRTGNRKIVNIRFHQQGDMHGVHWKDFFLQAISAIKKDIPEVFTALSSGFFEGEIITEKIELNASRKTFENSDALYGLFSALEDWFDKVGRDALEDEKEEERSARYQSIGLEVLKRWNDLIDQDRFARMRSGLLGVKIGRRGDGHVDEDDARHLGIEDEPSTRVGQGGANVKKTFTGEHAGATRKPESERDPHRPGDIPLGVIGHGRRRNLVKGDSIGLQLDYAPTDSLKLWEFDRDLGILTFNTSHRVWEMVEAKNRQLMALQDYVISSLLTILTQPEDQFEFLCDFKERELLLIVETVILHPATVRKT